MDERSSQAEAEARFRLVFVHLDAVTAYARRRSAPEPEDVAAEVMGIAWRRLSDVPAGDEALPWLLGTARNVVFAQRRRHGRQPVPSASVVELIEAEPPPMQTPGDPAVALALGALSEADRELLTLIAWEDLSPAQAAAALGIGPVTLRVRLHRARKRFVEAMSNPSPPHSQQEMEALNEY